jgi:hypothetical protein
MQKFRTAIAALVLSAAPFLDITVANALGEIYPSYIGIPASIAANLQWTHDPATVSGTYLNTIITPAFNQ